MQINGRGEDASTLSECNKKRAITNAIKNGCILIVDVNLLCSNYFSVKSSENSNDLKRVK